MNYLILNSIILKSLFPLKFTLVNYIQYHYFFMNLRFWLIYLTIAKWIFYLFNDEFSKKEYGLSYYWVVYPNIFPFCKYFGNGLVILIQNNIIVVLEFFTFGVNNYCFGMDIVYIKSMRLPGIIRQKYTLYIRQVNFLPPR